VHSTQSSHACHHVATRDRHHRKILLCREPESLPRAVEKALGKDGPLPRARYDVRQRPLCRGPKAGCRQRPPLPRVVRSAKESSRQSLWTSNGSTCRPLCRVPNVRLSAKDGSLPSASLKGPRQILLCRVSYLALGKAFYFFCFFDLNFFVRLLDTVSNPILKFGRSLSFFCYI